MLMNPSRPKPAIRRRAGSSPFRSRPARTRGWFGLLLVILAGLSRPVSAASGDLDTAFAMLALAVQHGLFDRHWLERCPLLVGLRADPRYPPLHAKVAGRAHAVLDALYGDHAHRATADTMLVASVIP